MRHNEPSASVEPQRTEHYPIRRDNFKQLNAPLDFARDEITNQRLQVLVLDPAGDSFLASVDTLRWNLEPHIGKNHSPALLNLRMLSMCSHVMQEAIKDVLHPQWLLASVYP